MGLRRFSTLAFCVFAFVMAANLVCALGAARAQCCHRRCRQHCCEDCYQDGAAEPLEEGEPSLDDETADLDFDFDQFAATPQDTFVAQQTNVGYIDTAIPQTQLRTRLDLAYSINQADRAEFLYTTWTTFGGRLPNPPNPPDPDVNFQAMSIYYEQAFTPNFSGFVEPRVLFNDPSIVANHAGFGDMEAGLKLALVNTPDQVLSIQIRNYIPTGNPRAWLTAGHYSIEPALLYYQRLSSRLTFESEFRDWVPIGGAVNPQNGKNYAGNVLRYGMGLGYRVIDGCRWSVTPIAEFVGWTVLDGQVFEFNGQGPALGPPGTGGNPVSAAGDTIVNAKIGARVFSCGGSSIYMGYGRSLTGDRWYRDIARFELRKLF